MLEKLMMDRALFHIHSNYLFNDNQYGFTPQKGTVDTAMEVKNFTEESLRLKQSACNRDCIGCILMGQHPEEVKRT